MGQTSANPDGTRTGRLTRLQVFLTFYLTSFLLDISEDWDFPYAVGVTLLAVGYLTIRRMPRLEYALCLIAGSIFILATEFPDVGNHNNIFLMANLVLLPTLIFSHFHRNSGWDDGRVFDFIASPLRVSIAIIYFFTGFHKFNWDFLNPDVSCGAQFFLGMFHVIHVPEPSLPGNALVAVAVAVLIWEGLGGLALFVPRLQLPMMLVSWMVHSMFAMMVFFDFSSMAVALLLLFLPQAYWERMEAAAVRVPWLMHRATVYIIPNTIMAVAAGSALLAGVDDMKIHAFQGLIFNLSVLFFLWPMFMMAWRWRTSPKWTGVPIWNRRSPWWLAALPAFVLFYGINPYLGLRTAGTFTMFSNLRTEGDTSNHILLGSNPIKVWGYQEDVVHIIEMDTRHEHRKDRRLDGLYLPVVEFKKMILEWRREGLNDLSATFIYDGKTYRTDDLVLDNPWDVERFDIEMWLMDFRVIQPEGEPTKCRW